MIKRIGRRFVSLLLTFVTVLTLLPAMTLPALAATNGTVTGLADENIGLSFTGNADNAWSASGLQIVGSATGKASESCGDSDTHYDSTLTITNNKTTKATLSFDYTTVLSDGTIQVDDTKVTMGGKFSKELAPNASIKVYIKSGSTSAATKITMTDVKLVSDATATVTFLPAENGSYTVDGKAITEVYTNSKSSKTAYQVKATPETGYKFMGWYDETEGKYIDTAPTTALNIEKDCTITARFVSNTTAIFETGGQVFDDLGKAITEAKKNPSATITLVNSGTITGSYTIPSGVTLLIPCDDAHTVYREMPGTIGNVKADHTQAVYAKLTMGSGTKLVVNGALSVAAQVSSANSSYTSVPTGKYGQIEMQDGASIVLESDSSLYCWGFITGKGDIVAKSGSKVYEEFQIADHRGGNKTRTLNSQEKTFPFSQYYVQNIEARLEIQYGAIEEAVCRMYATSDDPADITLHFIAKDSGGLFNLTSKDSKFVKWYDPQTERVSYEVYGDANLSSISFTLKVSIFSVKVNSAHFNLPIMQNTTINVKSGTTTIDQSLCLIPGSQVIVDEGATINIASGKSLFVYDRSDWVFKEWDKDTITVNGQQKPRYMYSGFTYPGSTDFRPEYYTPSRNSDNSKCWTTHFTTADMKDVKFDVNGTLNVAGKLYTTAGGADITSSLGSGKVVLSTAPTGDVTTHQYMQSRKEYKSSSGKYENDVSGYKEISATPAKLHNADGGYTPTAGAKAGDTFTYCKCQDCGNGTWVKDIAAIINNGTQGDTYSTLQAAVNEYTPNSNTAPTNYIKLLHSTTEKPISVNNKSLYLDLNGRTVTGDISVASGYKLYGMDSTAGADYTTAPKGTIVGTVKGCAPTYQTPGDTNDRYVAILSEENGTSTLSFHRFNISVTGYRFELTTGDTPKCALFFIGKFQGDKAARNHLTELGFTLKGENDKPLGEDNYKFTAGTDFPPMPAEGEAIDSKVVRSGDDFLFEVYLKRSFDKENRNGYTEEISATARAKFDNGGEQQSDPQALSFQKAWQNAEISDSAQQEILDNFLQKLGITKQTE